MTSDKPKLVINHRTVTTDSIGIIRDPTAGYPVFALEFDVMLDDVLLFKAHIGTLVIEYRRRMALNNDQPTAQQIKDRLNGLHPVTGTFMDILHEKLAENDQSLSDEAKDKTVAAVDELLRNELNPEHLGEFMMGALQWT